MADERQTVTENNCTGWRFDVDKPDEALEGVANAAEPGLRARDVGLPADLHTIRNVFQSGAADRQFA